MTRNDIRFLAALLSRIYVVLAVSYCVYIWFFVQNYHASIRTAIAVIGFALCCLLPERFTQNRLALPFVMLFGVIGISIMLGIVYSHSKG